ncbi:DegT/DnrJ/EryC1/StrS family aminotransferase [Sphingobacterium phlebotomi]|uniref:DegT/DnrJ/EryC1/StrS family aminotransferase n=1 Tax=Sphingobacterium phlebotomi TaxID=2605433 RepID=A0A5D4H7F5_9SPHI|nr:DegT/DnrJ/EryC1/StrS family aminotransferase [Sphingobacterium phlebotomi]TYR36618.1 DegT/DnrJ/EryC1/StrS family aminotransferase [Sphingobacterium phlebotomi]
MNYSRREFLRQGSIMGAGLLAAPTILTASSLTAGVPAILGGAPVLANKQWTKWPVWNPATDDERLLRVVRSGVWSRAKVVAEFEEAWATAVGSKRSLTTVNGTNALITAISQFDIGPGDEVIVPPYTFIASIQAVLMNGAMPVFADIDPATFQMDPREVEKKITPRTKAILPVHIMGLPVDMDSIMEIARQHNLIVIEDSCQAHLAVYGGKKVGTIGHAGCFSFQNSKNLPIGEGGAVVSDDDSFMDRCFSYHNLGMPYGTAVGVVSGGSAIVGTKVRLTEYQAAIGLIMLERLDEETNTRHNNAAYLNSLVGDIPGIVPAKLYDKTERGAYHLYPFRFQENEFKGLSRVAFLKALRAEGVRCSSGYDSLTDKAYLNDAFTSPVYTNAYSAADLDFKLFVERNRCANSELLCDKEAVWLPQNLLLGPRTDMEEIASAMERIYKNADQIKKKIS